MSNLFTVSPKPLKIANPQDHPGNLVGIPVELEPQELAGMNPGWNRRAVGIQHPEGRPDRHL